MSVNILIGLVQPFNQFVDSMLTGKGLGVAALAAYALFLPVSSLVLALSSFFSIGTQITCSHMLGSGRFDETGKLIRTSFLSATVFSTVFAAVLFGFSSQVAVILGASDAFAGQIQDTASYLRGYAPGIPAIFLVTIMMSLLQLEGKKHLVVRLSLCIFVINGTLDIANLYLFKMGLFGMAAATAAAYIAVFLDLLRYFLTSSKMFRFSLAGFQKKELFSIFKNGLPSLSYYGSLVIRTAFFNMLILMKFDGNALAIMAVINSFTSVVDATIGGPGDATLLLGGVLFGQKDIKGLRKLLKTALISSTALLFVITALTWIFATFIAGLFAGTSDPAFIQGTAGAVRVASICFVVDVAACVMKKYIQSVGRARYTFVTNILTNVVYVCVSAWILVNAIGGDGLYLSYTACYALALLTHLFYGYKTSRASGREGFDRLLFLPVDYEVSDDNQWIYSVDDIEGCVRASREMADFCNARGADKKTTYNLSLFIEEMTTNVVKYGFRDGRKNIIVIKLLFSNGRVTLNIMDNCPLFDPTHYYDSLKENGDLFGGIGIRLVIKLAQNVVYTNSFNLNNVMIEA